MNIAQTAVAAADHEAADTGEFCVSVVSGRASFPTRRLDTDPMCGRLAAWPAPRQPFAPLTLTICSRFSTFTQRTEVEDRGRPPRLRWARGDV